MNRKKIWRNVKEKLCPPATNNQVIPMVNVKGQDQQAPTPAVAETSEILSIVTMLLTMMAFFLNVVIVFQWNTTETITMRSIINIATMTVTHIVWIAISQQLKQYAGQLVSQLRGWFDLSAN